MTETVDIGLYSGDNGGDIYLIDGDINTTETLYQVIYISLFGGNVESNTLGNEISDEERSDYWANNLFFNNNESVQFNSSTERVLNNTSLTSLGRLSIKNSVEQDLLFLKEIVTFEVNVYILSSSRVSIEVYISGLLNNENKTYQLIWDNAKQEVILDLQDTPNILVPIDDSLALQQELQYEL